MPKRCSLPPVFSNPPPLYITAEVMHDWAQKSPAGGSDLITAVSKKAAVPTSAWDVVDLEPECTLFSTTNVQN